jgi:xanthosine utilization system XapX-like protein
MSKPQLYLAAATAGILLGVAWWILDFIWSNLISHQPPQITYIGLAAATAVGFLCGYRRALIETKTVPPSI